MTSELKPCLSCKGEARLFRRSGVKGKVCPSKWYRERVECKVCGLTTREYKKPNAAVHSWNTRAVPDVTELVRYRPSLLACLGGEHRDPEGEYIRYDQAAAVFAQKDAEIKYWKSECLREAELATHIANDRNDYEDRAKEAEVKLAQVEAENERLKIDASKHAHDAETVRRERDALIAKLAQSEEQEAAHYKCSGCDRVTYDPQEDMRKLRLGGYMSCCPERKMLPYYTAPVSSDAELRAERDRYKQALERIANSDDTPFRIAVHAKTALNPSEPRT